MAASLVVAATHSHQHQSVRLVAVALDGRPQFAHVWTEARTRDGRWIEFDVTRAAQGLDGRRIGRTLVVRV